MNEADQEFRNWVQSYEVWYRRSSRNWKIASLLCRYLSLASSIVTVLLAATTTKEFFADWGKWLIVGTSVLGIISSEAVAQLRIRKMEELRENGRIAAANLLAYVRDKLEEYSNDRTQIFKLKDDVRDRIKQLEELQHMHFLDINSEAHPSSDEKLQPNDMSAQDRNVTQRAK